MSSFVPQHTISEVRKFQWRPHQAKAVVVRKVFRGAARNGQNKVRARRDKRGSGEVRNPHRDMSAVAECRERRIDRARSTSDNRHKDV